MQNVLTVHCSFPKSRCKSREVSDPFNLSAQNDVTSPTFYQHHPIRRTHLRGCCGPHLAFCPAPGPGFSSGNFHPFPGRDLWCLGFSAQAQPFLTSEPWLTIL